MEKTPKMVDINDIPVGSMFRVKEDICRVPKDSITKAEKWWKYLPEVQKVKIYKDIQEAVHGYWIEIEEEKRRNSSKEDHS